jgi:hypothetical protein
MMLLLWIQIADAMYPPWYLVQIMIALAHIIPKAKLVTHRDIAEFGFKDLVKRKRAEKNPVAYIGNPRGWGLLGRSSCLEFEASPGFELETTTTLRAGTGSAFPAFKKLVVGIWDRAF